MREAMIVCPMKDNKGNPLDHVRAHAEHTMAQAFGGVTTTPATGSWVSKKGEFIQEPVWQLVSAMDATRENDDALQDVAKFILRNGRQQAVYVRKSNGDVLIIEADTDDLIQRLRDKAKENNQHIVAAMQHELEMALDDIDYEGFNDLGPQWAGNK